jgi:hypothetical protein
MFDFLSMMQTESSLCPGRCRHLIEKMWKKIHKIRTETFGASITTSHPKREHMNIQMASMVSSCRRLTKSDLMMTWLQDYQEPVSRNGVNWHRLDY